MSAFLSYRREDSGGYAGRLADDLAGHFGKRLIFRDVDSIRPGVDFVEAIESAVGACTVLVAVIGRDWLDAVTTSGARRLDNPDDFVRLEIGAALQRDIPIIPVLVEGAKMPSAADLPPELSRLSRYNAIELTDQGWTYGVTRLVEVLQDRVSPSRSVPRWIKFAGPAAAVVGLVLAVVLLWPQAARVQAPTPTTGPDTTSATVTPPPPRSTTTQTSQLPVVKSTGTTIIHGTFSFDLDTGQETQAGADVFWAQLTQTTRRLEPRNGARVAVLGAVNFDNLTPAGLKAASYSDLPVNGGDAGDQMPVGSVIAIRTNQGDFAKVRIEARNVPGTRSGTIQNIRIRWTTFEG